MFTQLAAAWAAIGATLKWIKEVKRNAKVRLAPERGRRDRRALETLSIAMVQGKDDQLPRWARMVMRLLGLGQDFGVYVQTVLKSRELHALTGAPDIQSLTKAEAYKLLTIYDGGNLAASSKRSQMAAVVRAIHQALSTGAQPYDGYGTIGQFPPQVRKKDSTDE